MLVTEPLDNTKLDGLSVIEQECGELTEGVILDE